VAAISFDAGSISADLTLDRSDFTRGLAEARAEAGKGVKLPVIFDIGKASMTDAITKAKVAFASASASMPITFSVSAASMAAVLRDAKAKFRSASATMPLQFSVTTAAVTAGAVLARAAFKASGQSVTMPITFTVASAAVAAGAVAARAAFKASAQAVTMPVTFNVSAGSLVAATAGAKGLAAATNTAAAAARGAGGAFGFLTRQVPLFGGLLNKILPDALRSVAVWHILGDAVIEFGAVTIPATIAVTAWGVAAADAVNNVVRQVTAYHTVSDAFQQSLPIFGKATGAMEALHKAVQPQVYQLFGDALTIMNAKTGEFSQLALGTGTILDRLGARFANAVTSGNTFSVFMKNAIPDVAKIGDSLGNLGGVFGNLMKAVPGYANVLLNLFDGFTKIAETATRVAEPVIAVGLALHGFILYTGLAVTASLAMIGGLATLTKSFFTFSASAVSGGVTAIKDFAVALWAGLTAVGGYIAEIGTMILVNGVGAASITVLGDAMALLAAIDPMVWVAVAVVAIAGFVYWANTAKDSTQKWYDTLQKSLLAAPAGFRGLALAQSDLALGTAKVAGAQKAANDAIGKSGPVVGAAGRYMTNYSAAADHATQKLAEVQIGNAQLRAEIGRGNATMTVWAGKFGGVASATGLATIAGITYGNQIDKNSTQQAINIQQMAAAQQGLQMMGVQAGTLGNDMQILTQQTTDQYKAVQNLNTGLATFIGNVTGTQTSFDTVALGGITLAANLTAANHAAQTTTHTMGGLKVASTLAGAAMDGTSQASVTLNQAFATQVGNINTLAASWRTAGIASNLQTQGMKDAIAPMMQYAKGSQEATDQLIALAATAGAPSWVTSFATLTRWLGNTSGAYANMKAITDQATRQEALLSGAMQDQGKVITGQLIGDINAAVLAYSGVGPAATAFGLALAKFGPGSTEAKNAAAVLETGMIKAGRAVNDTNAQIAAQLVAIPSLGLTMKQAMAVVTGALYGANPAFSTIAGDITSLHLKVPGLATDMANLAQKVQDSSDKSTAGHAARVGLYEDLISTGKGAIWATTQYDILTGNIGKIPKDVTTGIHVNADGSWSVGETTVSVAAASKADINPITHLSTFHAQGWRVPGYGGGDKHPAMLEGGEAVVPKHLVGPIAPYLSANKVPGFTSGAFVKSGNAGTGAAVGNWADGMYNATNSAVSVTTASEMIVAINKAIKAAAAAAISGVAGPGGGSDAANAALARQMMPAWASGSEWAAWNQVAMMESGWSASAANPTSSARGIAQNISGYGPGYLAGNAASQISWMIQYIQGRYGDPIGALAHENAYHWYGTGTQGAAPGWGVVGEQGPELVKFHGGEQVVPHAASMGALGGLPGYASGTGSAAALAAQIKLLRLQASLAGKVGSENRVTALIAKHLAAEKTAHTPKERALYAGEVATERRELALWRSQASVLSRQIAALGGHAAVTAAGKVPAAVAAAHFSALAEAGKDLMATHRDSATGKTLNSLIAGASKAVTDDKLLEAVPGIGAKEKKQLAAREVVSSRLLNFWTAESAELMAYRTQLANSNATLRNDIGAAKDMKLTSLATSLGKQLTGQVETVQDINAWLGPTAAQTAAAAAAAAAKAAAAATAAATAAAAGPSGQDLITAWLTAQGWVVGGTITPPAAKAMQWFDTGGRLPEGIHMVGNQTGGSERILSHGEEDALSRLAGGTGGSKVEALLGQVVRLLGDAPGKTAAGVGDAINGAARGAVRRGAYTTR
jgi:hypothetical protein